MGFHKPLMFEAIDFNTSIRSKPGTLAKCWGFQGVGSYGSTKRRVPMAVWLYICCLVFCWWDFCWWVLRCFVFCCLVLCCSVFCCLYSFCWYTLVAQLFVGLLVLLWWSEWTSFMNDQNLPFLGNQRWCKVCVFVYFNTKCNAGKQFACTEKNWIWLMFETSNQNERLKQLLPFLCVLWLAQKKQKTHEVPQAFWQEPLHGSWEWRCFF